MTFLKKLKGARLDGKSGQNPLDSYKRTKTGGILFQIAGERFNTLPDPNWYDGFLRANPFNEHDKNAVEIHIINCDATTTHIGHLFREHAQRMSQYVQRKGAVFGRVVIEDSTTAKFLYNPLRDTLRHTDIEWTEYGFSMDVECDE
jgi:hypothetical protein